MPPPQIRNILKAGERVERDLYLQASAGLVNDVYLAHRYGVNEDIDVIDEWHTLWSLGHDYPRVEAAGNIELVSTSADDYVDGTGARRILMLGNDLEGKRLTEN